MKRKIMIVAMAFFIAADCSIMLGGAAAGDDVSFMDPFYKVNAKKHSWQDYYDTWKKYRPDDSEEKILRTYIFHGGKDTVSTPETPAATGVTPVNENPSATGVTPVDKPAAAVEKPSDFIYDPDMHITGSDKPVEHFYHSEKYPDGSEKRVGYRYDAIKGTPNTAVTRYITIYYDNKKGNEHAELYRRWETYDIQTGKWVPTDASNEAFVKPSENKDVWASDIDAYKSIKDETIPSFDKLSEAEQKLCIINLGLSEDQCKALGFTARVSAEEMQAHVNFANGFSNAELEDNNDTSATGKEGSGIFGKFNSYSSAGTSADSNQNSPTVDTGAVDEQSDNTTSQDTIDAFRPR